MGRPKYPGAQEMTRNIPGKNEPGEKQAVPGPSK